MSLRAEVLLWAQRVVARRTDSPPHVLLEIAVDAPLEAAQEAFHKVARTGHPDLHRSSLTPEELEVVTSAYARVAGAYQELRSKRTTSQRSPTLRYDPPPASSPPKRSPTMQSEPAPATRSPTMQSEPAPVKRSPTMQSEPAPATRSPTMQNEPTKRSPTLRNEPTSSDKIPAHAVGSPSPSASQPGTPQPMNSKALIYYRKAEMCLRQGDLKHAVLNMKMAIAGDPTSAFLRSALTEIEVEINKK